MDWAWSKLPINKQGNIYGPNAQGKIIDSYSYNDAYIQNNNSGTRLKTANYRTLLNFIIFKCSLNYFFK